MNRRKKNEGFTLAELLITIAIMGILMGFGFVEVISQQRRLKLKEADEIAKQIYLGAQNHLTGSWASGEWQALINTKPASYFGVSGLIDSSAQTKEGHSYFYISNYPSSEHDALSDVILPYGSIDETIRSGGTYVIDYDLTTATVYEVFYIGYKTQINAEDVANAKNNSLGVWDRIQYALDHRLNNKPRYVGYYGVGEVELGPVSNYNPASISVKNEENLWLEITDSNIDKHPNDVLTVIISGKLSNAKVALRIPLDNSSTSISNQYKPVPNNERYISDNDVQMYYESPYLAKSEIVGNNRVYYVLLDSLTFDRNITIQYPEDKKEGTGVFGQFGKHFGVKYGFFIGENLSIQAYLNDPTTGDESFTERPEFANSLFNNLADPENADETYSETGASDYIAMIKNARHLQNLSMDASGITYQPTKIGETNNTFNFVGARLENDIDWNMYAANLSSCPSSKTGISNFCSEWKTLRTNRYNIVTNNNSAEVRHEDGMYFRPISNGYTSGVKWPRFQKSIFDFYGKGLHIFNLDIYRYDADLGLFAQSRDGAKLRIHNLNLVDPCARVIGTDNYIGLFCAKVSREGTSTETSVTLDNCHAYMSDSEQYRAGSYNYKTGTINNNEKRKGIIARCAAAGGLIGSVEKNGSAFVYNSSASVPIFYDIENDSNNGDKLCVGGLIGYVDSYVTIENSYVGGYAQTTLTDNHVDYSEESMNLSLVSAAGKKNGVIGGFVGKLLGNNCTIRNCYSTASVYFGLDNTNGSGFAGGFVGYMAENNNSTIQNCYSAGRVFTKMDYSGNYGAFSGTSKGTFKNIKNNEYFDYSHYNSEFPDGLRHVDGNYLNNVTGFEYPDTVLQTYAAKPYNNTLGSVYPFTPVAESASIKVNEQDYRHYGDWPNPRTLDVSFDGDYGIIYYEIVQHGRNKNNSSDAYYRGIMAETSFDNPVYKEVETYMTLSSPGMLTKGILNAPDGGEYVSEAGYLMLVKNNIESDDIRFGTWNTPETIESYSSMLRKYEDIDDILNIKGFNCYFIDPTTDLFKGRIRGKLNGMDWECYKYKDYNWKNVGTIYFNPYFSNEVSNSPLYKTQDINNNTITHVMRSATTLKNLFDINGGRYITSDSSGQNIVTQTMDITFASNEIKFMTCGSDGKRVEYTECYTSPTLNDALNGTYQSNSKTNGDYYKIIGLNNPFIRGGITQNGHLKNLVIENANSQNSSYFIGSNAGEISSILFNNCGFRKGYGDVPNNGLINGDNSGQVANLQFRNCTLSDNAIALTNTGTISNITISNSYIGKNGICESNTYSNGTIDNISIDNATIEGNGLTETNNKTINNVTISNVTIKENGFCDSNAQGTISNARIINAQIGKNGFVNETVNGAIVNCHVYGDEVIYSEYQNTYKDGQRKYHPNTNTSEDFDHKEEGYNLVTIGLALDQAMSSVSGDYAGFAGTVRQTNINGCSVTGKVYGNEKTSGFVNDVKQGTISNSYSNTLVYSKSGIATGFFNNNTGTITGCLALGVLKGNSTVGFGHEQDQGIGTVENSYCDIWDKHPTSYYEFTDSPNTNRFTNCYYLHNGEAITPNIPGKIEPITALELSENSHSLGAYISRNKTHPYHQFGFVADVYPFPMPVYNGSAQDEYGDWYSGLETVTVTFDGNGNGALVNGASETMTVSIYKGKKIGDLPSASWTFKDNRPLTLLGWFRNPDPFTNDQIDENEIITEDVTFYAHWGEIKEIQSNTLETFKTPRAGLYLFESWGAGSEDTELYDGSYTSGLMYVDKDKSFYVKTGDDGAESVVSTSNSSNVKDFNKARIMVAAGANTDSGYYSKELGIDNNSFVSGAKDNNSVANIKNNNNLLFTGQNIHHSGWAFADGLISNHEETTPSSEMDYGFVRITRIVLDKDDTTDASKLTNYSNGTYGGQVFDVTSTAGNISITPDQITVYVGESLTKKQLVERVNMICHVTTTVNPKSGKTIDPAHIEYVNQTEFDSRIYLSDIADTDITIKESEKYDLVDNKYTFKEQGEILNNTVKYNNKNYSFKISIDPSLQINFDVLGKKGEVTTPVKTGEVILLTTGTKTNADLARDGFNTVSESTPVYEEWYKYQFNRAELLIDGVSLGVLESFTKTEESTTYKLVSGEETELSSINVKVNLYYEYTDNLNFKIVTTDEDSTSLHGNVDETGKLSVIAYRNEGDEGFDITSAVHLSSNNEAIATVDRAGTVTYRQKGVTGIKAVVDEDHSYLCKVFVKEAEDEDYPVDSIERVVISPDTVEEYAGKTVALALLGGYSSGDEQPISNNITWTVQSSDNSNDNTAGDPVVTVDEHGSVVLVNPGTATVIATYTDGENSFTAQCTITVKANPVVQLTSSMPKINGAPSDEFDNFTVFAIYEDETQTDITGEEGVLLFDPEAISIIDHKVTLRKDGSYHITARFGDKELDIPVSISTPAEITNFDTPGGKYEMVVNNMTFDIPYYLTANARGEDGGNIVPGGRFYVSQSNKLYYVRNEITNASWVQLLSEFDTVVTVWHSNRNLTDNNLCLESGGNYYVFADGTYSPTVVDTSNSSWINITSYLRQANALSFKPNLLMGFKPQNLTPDSADAENGATLPFSSPTLASLVPPTELEVTTMPEEENVPQEKPITESEEPEQDEPVVEGDKENADEQQLSFLDQPQESNLQTFEPVSEEIGQEETDNTTSVTGKGVLDVEVEKTKFKALLPTSSPSLAQLMEDTSEFHVDAVEEESFVTADTYDVTYFLDQRDAVLPNLWKRIGENKFRVNPYEYEWRSDDEDIVICNWGAVELIGTGETKLRATIDDKDVVIRVTVEENPEITGFKEKGNDYSVALTDGSVFSAETRKWPSQEPKDNTQESIKVYGTRIAEESGVFYLIADDFEADWEALTGNIGSYLSDADEDGNHKVVKLPVSELLDEDDFFEDGEPKVELLPGDAYHNDDTVYVLVNSDDHPVSPEVDPESWLNLKDMKEYVPGADTGPETDLAYYPGSEFNPYPGTIKSNCTYAVWALVNQTLGIKLPGWGNAGSWLRRAQISGYPTGNKPAKYSIIVFDTHVGFVTEVNEDGTMMFIKEGNYAGKYHEQWWSVGPRRGSLNVLGYIYLTNDQGETYEADTIVLDEVYHDTEEEFLLRLAELGLEAGERTEEYSDEVEEGHILSYQTGEYLKGSVVDYVVSKGPEPVKTIKVDETYRNKPEAELLDWFDKNGKLKGSRIVVDADGNAIEDEENHDPSNYVVVSIQTGEYEEGSTVSYKVTKKVTESTDPEEVIEDPDTNDPAVTPGTEPETTETPAAGGTEQTATDSEKQVTPAEPQTTETPVAPTVVEEKKDETQNLNPESTVATDAQTDVVGVVGQDGGEMAEEQVATPTPEPTPESTPETTQDPTPTPVTTPEAGEGA